MDTEKVIHDLECCTCNEPNACRGCSLNCNLGFGCTEDLLKEALELLKEQKARIEQLNRFVNGFSREAVPVVRCKDCKHYKDGFCYNPNTYDDEKTKGNTVPDWFCADGERR